VWSNGVLHDLGTLPAPDNSGSAALSINDLGEVAGTSGNHAFIWRDGHMTDLGALGGQGSAVADINNLGAVAGEVNVHEGPYEVAVWARGQWTAIPNSFEAFAINDLGQVLFDDGTNFPYLWTGGQATSVFNICPGLTSAEAFFESGLNDQSWIAGTEAEPGPVYDVPVVCQPDGTVIQLPQVAGSSLGDYAAAINNLGDVAGTATSGTGSDVVLWRPGLSG
jgi:probable HAF family extracellular repeat protein